MEAVRLEAQQERLEHDRLIGKNDLVDLDAHGVARFVTRKRIWKLNVQGVILDVLTPTIVVREALLEAGFNPDQGWHIFLKVHGEPKRAVTLTDTIDLRTPGIEKLRLLPRRSTTARHPLRSVETSISSTSTKRISAVSAFAGRLSRKQPAGGWLSMTTRCREAIRQARRCWRLRSRQHTRAPRSMASTLIPLGAIVRPVDRERSASRIHSRARISWVVAQPRFDAVESRADRVATQLALVDAALAKEVGE